MGFKKRNYSIAGIILPLVIGSIFTVLGIALAVIIIESIIKDGLQEIDVGIIMPLIFILALLGFGITALIMSGKEIYLWVREVKIKKCGKCGTAHITNYKSANFSKSANVRKRYALVLSYTDGKVNKNFTTGYLFDINEFRYLKGLERIKIKIDGNFVIVNEQFPKDIYKVDSTYGIEVEFYKQKPVKILMRLWVLFFFLAIAFLIISMIIGNGNITHIAIIILFAVNFPFAISLAVYLIKWFRRKK